MTDVLHTARLTLRPFAPGDGPEMFRVWAADERVTRYLRWTPHQSEAESCALADRWAAESGRPDVHQWAIVRTGDGQLMGSVGVVADEEDDTLQEPGYCLGHDFWGRGYMTEALGAVVHHLFCAHDLPRLGACRALANPASGRVLEKIGFRCTGERVCHKFDGTPLPCCAYILYKEEYLKKL